jgi:hypothetical protein
MGEDKLAREAIEKLAQAMGYKLIFTQFEGVVLDDSFWRKKLEESNSEAGVKKGEEMK